MSAEAVSYGVLFARWLIAGMLGGFLVVRSLHALLEREVRTWEGLLGIGLGVAVPVVALSLAASAWYLPFIAFVALALSAAHSAAAFANRRRARQMLEQDAARYRAAIESDPKNAAAHAFLAAVYHKQRRLLDAVSEYEAALQLDPQDAESRRNLKALVAELQAEPGVMRCPRCEAVLDGAQKTCPGCGWSRSTVQGLRKLYTRGDLKRALLYAGLVTASIVIYSLLFRISLEMSLTLLFVGWLACVVLFFYWVVRDVV